MKRKFSLLILMSLSALSAPAWSLGMGEAQVESALGAPLEATIPLTDTQGLEPRGVTVSLADAESYQRAGLERSLLLDGVSLSVVPESGRLSIRLSSERTVRAPYLDLLLNIDGPDGRQQRQVTLLFDPPGFGSQQAPSATSPSASTQQANIQQPDSGRGAVTRQSTPQSVGPSPEVSQAPGYVNVGETLWSIARKLRPDADVSLSQMMMALLDANPNAFPGGNINRLRAGYVLEIPTRGQITSRSADEAWQRVQAHNRAFARGEPVPGVAASPERASGSDATEQTADMASGGPDASQSEVSASSGSEDGRQRSALTSEDSRPSSPATSTSSISDSRPGDQSDAQSETPRLTLLTDAEVESEANADAVDSLSNEQAVRLNRLEAQLSESQQSLAEIRAERDSAEAELAAMREEVANMRDTLETLAKAQSPSAAQTQGESASDGIVDRYLMPLWTTIAQAGRSLSGQLAAAGLALLLALWWWVRRRRATDEDNATDNASAVAAASVRDTGSTEKPRGKSDRFAPDARDVLMPKAEAVSEADILIAYGRYDKARALLEESLEAEPDRHDLRVKLVKVLVEQGRWQEAHMEAARLAADDDPGRQAELERLLARERGVPSSTEPEAEAHSGAHGSEVDEAEPLQSPQASPSDEADTASDIELEPVESTLTFRPPLEREPVAFDGKHHHAEPSWQQGKEVDPEQIREALQEASISQQRDSDDGDASSVATHSADQPQPIDEQETETRTRDGQRVDENGQEASSKPVVEGIAERENEPSDSTRDHVIDYRPPTLEVETAPPEETPMQPSVEFPHSQASAPAGEATSGDVQEAHSEEQDIPALGEDAGSDLADLMREPDKSSPGSASGINEEEWDIEEVAFEPLHLDNGQPVDSPALTRSLVGDAEALLEQGNHAKAQDMLARALNEGDSETREQAKRLIAQHNL